MPRCLRGSGNSQARRDSDCEVDPALRAFWAGLSQLDRQRLLRVDKRALFQRIRSQYCSRCFGLFAMRYDELKGSAALDCPACLEFYSGLVVSGGQLTLEDKVANAAAGPFVTFEEARLRERERELQFMTGDICGSGWQKRPGRSTVCALHTSPVPYEAIAEYWHGLPEDHRTALFRLREEDFCAELDAHLKYQLRVCRDCRGNVLKSFKELKPAAKRAGSTEPAERLEVCEGHHLTIADGLVSVDCEEETPANFFLLAEEVEDGKAGTEVSMGDEENPDGVRHAETPELAREALRDSVALIYKGQVEVAFREQTAGHNALLLFVHLALGMMEEQLLNAFKELDVKQAEAELLDLVAKEVKKEPRKGKKKGKKPARQASKDAACMCTSETVCPYCAALQASSSPPSSPARSQSPHSTAPVSSPPRLPSHLFTDRPPSPGLSQDSGWEVQSGKRRGPAGAAAKRSSSDAASAPPTVAAPQPAPAAPSAQAMPAVTQQRPPPASSLTAPAPTPAVQQPAGKAADAIVLATRPAWQQQQQQQQQPVCSPWKVPVAAVGPSRAGLAAIQFSSWDPWGFRDSGAVDQLLVHKPGVPDWSWAPQPARALGAFSLFAASPASSGQQCHGGGKGQPQEELKSYQLFGAQEAHPLAPVLGSL